MLANYFSALLAAVPMAAALSVRAGPGGFGRGGARAGIGGTFNDGLRGAGLDESLQFRVVTYDLEFARTQLYLGASLEIDAGQYSLIQRREIDEAGIFEITEDRTLVYTSADGTTLRSLIASFLPRDFEVADPALPSRVVFGSENAISTLGATEWEWVVDFEDRTLALYSSTSENPYYLLLCNGKGEVYLAVGIDTVKYTTDVCVAVHLIIEPVRD